MGSRKLNTLGTEWEFDWIKKSACTLDTGLDKEHFISVVIQGGIKKHMSNVIKGCLVDLGKSRDRKKYRNKTKPNIYRNGFENFRIVESQIRERYGAER